MRRTHNDSQAPAVPGLSLGDAQSPLSAWSRDESLSPLPSGFIINLCAMQPCTAYSFTSAICM